MPTFLFALFIGWGSLALGFPGPSAPPDAAAAARALDNLTDHPHMGITLPILDGDFLFENLWWTWDDSFADKWQMAFLTSEQKRKMVFSHYGLISNPAQPDLPIGFVKRQGFLAMNCLACHAGQVQGQMFIGVPNRNIDLHGLFNDMAILNPVGGLVLRTAATSLGPERGLVTTFGMEQMSLQFRDQNMDLKLIPNFWGFFSDAVAKVPAWWNLNYKTHAFTDAVIPLTPRIFVTSAAAVWESGPDFRAYESAVSDAFELGKSTVPPKFPGPINLDLAAFGRKSFDQNCARCHGHYDRQGQILNYPNRIVSLSNVGTDPMRLDLENGYQTALDFLVKSWVALDFKNSVNSPTGYLAPPLIGIWATAPYLHNGSVPTLEDLLNPGRRPLVWEKSADPDDYDLVKVGMRYRPLENSSWHSDLSRGQQGLVYDTTKAGHSNQGHDYPDLLDEDEKRAVLEFLKLL